MLIENAATVLLFAFIIEALCALGRLFKGPMREKTGFLCRMTGGVRIHHGYWIVLVPGGVLWENYSGASTATEWVAIAGWALGVSDLWRHFITLPLQGNEHEFDLVFHKHPNPPQFLVRWEKALAKSEYFLWVMQKVTLGVTALLVYSTISPLLRHPA